MPKNPVVGTVKTGISDLSDLPFGSLLLIASHHRKWRDLTLIDATIFGAYGAPVCYLAISELVGLPERRYRDQLRALCNQWASDEALEICGYEPIDMSTSVRTKNSFEREAQSNVDQIAAEINAAHEKYERDLATWTEKHDRTQANALTRIEKESKTLAVSFVAMRGPTIETVLTEVGSMPAGSIVVVDDISAISKNAKESGSLKLCGDHARALKDAAIEKGILFVAGMPTTEIRDKRTDKERALTLEDFRPYGSPDAVADAVVTATPVLDARGWTVGDHILVSRY